MHDSGVVVRSAGRHAMQVEYEGRTATVSAEHSGGYSTLYLPQDPTWEGGVPIPPEVTNLLRRALREVLEFWGSTVEFVQLGD
jgi:hypothetical protein